MSKSSKNSTKIPGNTAKNLKIRPRRTKKSPKSSENTPLFDTIPTEKVGVKSQKVASGTVSEYKKTVKKCAHCGKDVVLDEEWAAELGDMDTICDMCSTPDWTVECMVCGARPTHRVTGMCGPCTFGEAETVDGNW